MAQSGFGGWACGYYASVMHRDDPAERIPAERIAAFKRSDGPLLAVMGGLMIGAAAIGVVMAVFLLRHPDMKTVLQIALGFAGAFALGVAIINAWRNPLLVARPDGITILTFFGTGDIPVRPGRPVGEYLATPAGTGPRGDGIEGNRFVHFCLQDRGGNLVRLLALHREAPDLPRVRCAFEEIAGLRLEQLKMIARGANSRPDVAHWR